MRTTMKFLLSSILVFAGLNSLFGQQRLLQPVIRTSSLVATPVLLERQSSIQDLEVVIMDYPDTLIVNQTVNLSGYIKNISCTLFDAKINLNFDLNQLEDVDVDDVENSLDGETDQTSQLPQVTIQPGDSIAFSKSVFIDPGKIDPNSTGIIIIWPEFRILQNDAESNYSLEQFYATGLSLGSHGAGPGKTVGNNNAYKLNNITLNSYFNLQNYLIENNYSSTNYVLTNIDGKVMLQQSQLPQLNVINELMATGSNRVAILNVVAEKTGLQPEIITIKLHK